MMTKELLKKSVHWLRLGVRNTMLNFGYIKSKVEILSLRKKADMT